ncbi:transcription factor of the MADS box [Malassezia yamatoensis]|uniref:Transcription factor of the MADS box n=1 Tax=Malassezia yamatoensis TaxID=253288 RepID=A0AAJ5Z150_9BASI|nr:transcription factor of the MADS box [Malassezia yamatoensis]
MSDPSSLQSYTTSNMDMNGLLVANCRPDQGGAYPPIYNVPHGTIQLAQGYNTLPGGASWPFSMAPVAASHQNGGMNNPYGQYTHPISSDPSQASNANPAGISMPSSSPAGNIPMHSMPGSSFQLGTQQRSMSSHGVNMPMTPTPTTSTSTNTANAPQPPTISTDTPRMMKAAGSDEAPDSSESAEGRTQGRKRMPAKGEKDTKTGRRKIKIEFIDDDSRRHITFSKRKAGIMKKAYELATLTGTQVLLLVVSQTGLVYTFTTPKLEAIVKQPEGRNLIQECLNAPGGSQDAMRHGAGASDQAWNSVEENDALEEGDEEEEEEEDAADLSAQADSSLVSQTQSFVTSPISEHPAYASPTGPAPYFHPGWTAMPSMSSAQPLDNKQINIKRRRTQPNLSTNTMQASTSHRPSLGELPYAPYPPTNLASLPVGRNRSDPPIMPNAFPMYYPTNMPPQDTPTQLGNNETGNPSIAPELHMSPQQDRSLQCAQPPPSS